MQTLLIATADGVWATEPSRCERVGLVGERITALAASPEAGVIYASTAAGRIHQSKDQGTTWTLQFQSKSRNRFTALAVSPSPPHPVYAGTWPADVFRSPVGGAWEQLESFREIEGAEGWVFPPPPHKARTTSFAFDPSDPSTIYATVELGGVMKSGNGGESWRPLTTDVNRDTHDVRLHPQDPAILYVSTGFGSTHRPGVYWSRDGGETWEFRYRDAHPVYTLRMCIDPVRPEVLHVVAYPYAPGDWHNPTGTGGTLMRTEDGGATWTAPHAGVHLPTVNYVPMIRPDPVGPGGVLFAISPFLPPTEPPKDGPSARYYNDDGYNPPLPYYNFTGNISPSMDPPTREARIVRSGPDGDTWEVVATGLPPLQDFLPLV